MKLCVISDWYYIQSNMYAEVTLWTTKSGLIRQVTFLKRFNSYEIVYDMTRKGWLFNTDDCLIEVTHKKCLMYIYIHIFSHHEYYRQQNSKSNH